MAKRCRCPRKTCAKRKGSKRFRPECKNKFRACMHEVLRDTGSMRAAGKKCMKPVLLACQKGKHVRSYKHLRAG